MLSFLVGSGTRAVGITGLESYSAKIAMPSRPEAAAYPHLERLFGAYFHQDFDLFGTTLAEILHTYAEDTSDAERQGTVADIQRFLKVYGHSDSALAGAVERVFRPAVILEGWEGLTVRQWLLEAARLLCSRA